MLFWIIVAILVVGVLSIVLFNRRKAGKLKVTLADGKVLKGTRRWYDAFWDGWSASVIHDVEIYSPDGLLLSKSGFVKVTNRWIVMREEDTVDAK